MTAQWLVEKSAFASKRKDFRAEILRASHVFMSIFVWWKCSIKNDLFLSRFGGCYRFITSHGFVMMVPQKRKTGSRVRAVVEAGNRKIPIVHKERGCIAPIRGLLTSLTADLWR